MCYNHDLDHLGSRDIQMATRVGCSVIRLASFNSPSPKPPIRCKDLGDISYRIRITPDTLCACAGLLESRGSRLELLKSTLHAENFICSLSWLVYLQSFCMHFTLEMHVAAQNCEKFTKTPYFGGWRSFKVIDVDISKKVVTSACCDKQHVCAYLQPFSR